MTPALYGTEREEGERWVLGRLTKVVDLFEADAGAGEGEHGFVDVGAAGVSAGEVAVGVQPGDGALHDPALFAQAGAVFCLAIRGVMPRSRSSRRWRLES